MATNLFKAARARGVSLFGVQTADPAHSIRQCLAQLNGKTNQIPLLVWDCSNGLSGYRGTNGKINQPGAELAGVLASPMEPQTLTNPAEFVRAVAANGDKLSVEGENGKALPAIVFMLHANRFLDNPAVMQGIWNCRDSLKQYGAMLVLLGPSLSIPAELKNDIVLMTEPLPSPEELGKIVDSICKDAGIEPQTLPDREIVLDSLTGVSAYGAENIFALSVTRDGVDQSVLTERQKNMIEQTKGLSVWRGGESFDDLGGLSNLKAFLTRILTSGKTPVRTVLFADEIEKQFAGIAGDSSGTSQDQFGAILQFLNDNRIPMMILVGHGGTGKSAIAKATGRIAKSPVLAMDFGAMKGSLVGQSEERIREAMQVALSVSNGKLMMICTCNKLASLPPEFKRRATLGVFMVDLPSAEERKSIWRIIMRQIGVEDQPLPADDQWTGAEIRSCCDIAYRTGLTLRQASQYVVPIAKSNPEAIKALRTLAHNSFISAHEDGVYKMPAEPERKAASGRVMDV